MLATAQRCARQLAGLVDNLLDASRIEAGQLSVQTTAVDLDAAVEGVIEVVRGSSSKHTLVAAVGPSARWVRADPERLRQILMNLVGNAVKYSPAGGQVLVAASRARTGRSSCRSPTRGSASRPRSSIGSSTRTSGSIRARRGASRAPGSGSTSSAIWSSCTAGRFGSRARSGGEHVPGRAAAGGAGGSRARRSPAESGGARCSPAPRRGRGIRPGVRPGRGCCGGRPSGRRGGARSGSRRPAA